MPNYQHIQHIQHIPFGRTFTPTKKLEYRANPQTTGATDLIPDCPRRTLN